MGVIHSSKGPELAVGSQLASVLPSNQGPWYRTKHLLILNLTLLVPLFSAATVGFDGSLMNGLQTLATWRTYFNHPTPALLGVINAMYPVGKVCGVYPATWLSDRYGRRTPLLFGFTIVLIGGVLQSAAHNVALLVVARFILGFGTAHLAQPSPVLVTELAYPPHRAKATALYNTFFYAGSVFAAWAVYGCRHYESDKSWRIPSILQCTIPLFQFMFMFFVPESPRWLVSRGRQSEARRILAKYHAAGDETSPLIDYEMAEIEETIQLERVSLSQFSYLDLLRTAPNRRRTLIAVILGFFSQWNGLTVASYYLTLVLNTVGIKSTKSQTLINGLLQIFNWIVAVTAGALMIDRIGRRTLFLTSCIGMLFSYITWTVISSVISASVVSHPSHDQTSYDQSLGYAVVAVIFITYFFYDIAWTPLLQAYVVEIFPFTLRSRGLTVALTSNWIGLIIAQVANPIALEAIHWKYYIVFCCNLFFLFFAVYFLFPETKGRSLEQIAKIFDKDQPINEGGGGGGGRSDSHDALAHGGGGDVEQGQQQGQGEKRPKSLEKCHQHPSNTTTGSSNGDISPGIEADHHEIERVLRV